MENLKKLAELIRDIEDVMLVTSGSKGRLHSRPMVTQQIDAEGNIWFLTGMSSQKVKEIEMNSHVNLSYSKPNENRFVSISGSAEVIRDAKKAKELWNPLYRAWFPKGLEDPDLVVLKVVAEDAEYWDTVSRGIVQLVGLTKAILTGKRYELGESQHGKVKI